MTSKDMQRSRSQMLQDSPDNRREDVLLQSAQFPRNADASVSSVSIGSSSRKVENVHRSLMEYTEKSHLESSPSTRHPASAGVNTKEKTKNRTKLEQHEMISRVEDPGPHDILLGRGKPFQSHHGNQHMLGLVDGLRAKYLNIDRRGKHEIIEHVMASIHKRGGRFLVRDEKDEFWQEVKRSISYRKVGHAFRSKVRRSSDFSDQDDDVKQILAAATRSEPRPTTPQGKCQNSLPKTSSGLTISAIAAANRTLGRILPTFPSRAVRGEHQDDNIVHSVTSRSSPLGASSQTIDVSSSQSALFGLPNAIQPLQGNTVMERGISGFIRQQQHNASLIHDVIAMQQRLNAQRELIQQQQQQLFRQDMFSHGNQMILPSTRTQILPSPTIYMPGSTMRSMPNTSFSNGGGGFGAANMMTIPGSMGGSMDPELEFLLLNRRQNMQFAQEQQFLIAMAQRQQRQQTPYHQHFQQDGRRDEKKYHK